MCVVNSPVRRFAAAVILTLAAQPSPAQTDEPPELRAALTLEGAFTRAIEQAEPSLVSVIRRRRDDTEELDAPWSRRTDASWLDVTNPNFVPTDFGSGVIVDPNGLILTNTHVIERARELVVILHTGRSYPAQVWACDPRSDLAMLKINVRDLQPIKLGDGGKAKKGQFVLALGNPMAVARDGRASASWGIVSNVARRLPPLPLDRSAADEIRTLHHSATLLQTDARLNWGMSGGALLNLHGEMIGLTTAWAAIRGYDQAAGYAIPIDDVTRRLLGVLLEGREVEYGFLGVAPRDLEPRTPESNSVSEGVVVEECFPGSPAAQAGLQEGDVVTHVSDEPIRSAEDLVLKVGTRLAGSRVQLRVVRGGQTVTLAPVLGKYFSVQGEIRAATVPPPWRGAHVDYITMVLRDTAGLRERPGARERLRSVPDGGVLATRVEPGSPAEAAGLHADVIITHVAGTPVRSPDEFRKAVAKVRGKVELTTDMGAIVVRE